MKRILLNLLVFFVSFYSFSQTERMPFGNKSSYTIDKVKYVKPAHDLRVKEVLFSENFDSYSENFSTKWEVKRDTSLKGLNLTDAVNPMWFLCKPSNFNNNGLTYINSGDRSAAISYTAPEYTWLFCRDTLDIPAEGEYSLSFWMWYYNNTYYQYITHFHIMTYDTDAQLWDTLASWGETSGSNQYKSKVIVPLEDYAGKSIRFAFVYENLDNKGTQMAIDDIVVTDSFTPDLNISAFDFKYSTIPLFLIDTFKFSFSSTVHNIGSILEDTAKISVTSIQLPDFISYAEIADTLEEGESRFVTGDSILKFTDLGHYKFVYDVSADQDEAIDNNTDTLNFKVSASTYATDYGVVGGLSLGQDQEFGNIFYIPEPCFINGLELGWPDFYSVNWVAFDFEVNIYELNPIDSTIEKNVLTQTISKDVTFSNTYSTLSFDPIYCNPGTNYFVTIRQLDSKPIGIGYDRVTNGAFWKVSSSKGNLERMANPAFGNVAVRLLMKEPDAEPILTFTINDGANPVADLDIVIVGVDTIKTNETGQAFIKLKNGTYYYNIYPSNFAPIRDTVKILYQNVNLDITLQKLYKAKFVVKSGTNTVTGAEINISDSVGITNNEGIDSLFLVPGTYPYSVTASGYEPYTDELVITSKDTTVDINLTTALTYSVTFTVTDDDFENLSMVKITLEGYGSKYTDDQGKVTFIGILPANQIFYYVSRNGYENGAGTVDVVDQNVEVGVEMILIRYKVIFYVTNGEVGLPNAQITLDEENPVTSDANGYAVVEGVAPDIDIPYAVSLNNFHAYSGKVSVIDADVRENIILTPLVIDKFDFTDLSLFPNPTSGIFKVVGEGSFEVIVFDLTGNLIEKVLIYESNHELDISDKPAGIYFVRIGNQLGSIVKRLIKR